jgi:hypothetical protein
MVRDGLGEVRQVADAIAEMTGKPLVAPTIVRRERAAEQPEQQADAASLRDASRAEAS